MMKTKVLDRGSVIEQCDLLTSFPRTVSEILETIDDPDSNLKVLVDCINHDPIIAARVLSVANQAAAHARRDASITDIYTATSLIGMKRVRQITLISSVKNLMGNMVSDRKGPTLWHHSVAVGVCCEETALHVDQPISTDMGLIAGLLHDIGQFWLHAIEPVAFHTCLENAAASGAAMEQMEQEYFGVSHATIGGWMAEHWGLPADICAAVAGHHNPDAGTGGILVSLVHVAEVLSNALELSVGTFNRVSYISNAACKRIGLKWDDSSQSLFGRIEARAQHANSFFA